MLLALKKYWAGTAPPAPTPTLPNSPGRVYTGVYPYWTKKPRHRPIEDDEEDEIEELMAMIGIEL